MTAMGMEPSAVKERCMRMATKNETIISFENVQKVYTNKSGMAYVALNGVSFEIKKGEFVAVMGPSGSGKTTVLDLMGTLDSPTGGSIIIAGRRVNEMSNSELAELRNMDIGFVFQSYNLVRKQYLRVIDKRPHYRNPLLFASAQLVWLFLKLIAKAHFFHELHSI